MAGELRLDVADGVVAEIAGEPAAKARQTRTWRGAVAAHELADERQRIAVVVLDDRAAVVDLDRGAARADAHLRRQADERIAPEPLAADHGFEEEGVRRVRELHVQRQRRIEVGERLEDERNAVVSLRGERAKFGFGHDASTISSTDDGAVGNLRGIACDARDAAVRTISASGASSSRASRAGAAGSRGDRREAHRVLGGGQRSAGTVRQRSDYTIGVAGLHRAVLQHSRCEFVAHLRDRRLVVGAPKIAEPATNVSAPACAIAAMLSIFTPPSTSSRICAARSLLRGVDARAGERELGERLGDERLAAEARIHRHDRARDRACRSCDRASRAASPD